MRIDEKKVFAEGFIAGQKAGREEQEKLVEDWMKISDEYLSECRRLKTEHESKVAKFEKILNSPDHSCTMMYSEYQRIFKKVKPEPTP